MSHHFVILDGVPAAQTKVKLGAFLSKQGVKGIIDIDRLHDGKVVLKFNTTRDLWEFEKANVREVEFGNTNYRLTVVETSGGKQEQAPATEQDQKNDDYWRRKLYVTNIPTFLDSRDALKHHFQRFGKVERCFVKEGRFACVTFTNHLDAVAAFYGARPAGPNHHLNIVWDRKETPSQGLQTNYPPPLMSVQVSRPVRTSHPGPRRSSSSMDLRQEERPQSAFQRQQPAMQRQDYDPAELYKNVHYWNSFKKLPAAEGTMCVLTQGIDESVRLETVKMHFENKRRSNGGYVRSIIRVVDGLLILFQDPKDCENCLEMKEQTFLSKKITIFAKRIPTYFKRKFVVEGVAPSTSVDILTLFLEHCSPHETSPLACTKQDLPGVYLIEYGEDFNPEEATEVLRNISGRPLEQKTLKAMQLLRTDCIKVTGIQDSVTNDAIRLKFESKKRTDGGPVTQVNRLKNNVALVYFSDFTDAERVCERFEKPSLETITIGEHPVEVELYFHSLAKDHQATIEETTPKQLRNKRNTTGATSKPKPPLRSFEFQPQCKAKLLDLLRNNPSHMENISKSFTSFAVVQIMEKKEKKPSLVKCSPDKKTEVENQKAFNAECKKRFNDVLSNFSCVSPTFEKSKLDKARSAKLSPLMEKDYKGDGVSIIVSWKNDSVDVTGVKDAVDNFIDQIKASLDFTEKKMEISSDQYRYMVSCGVIAELDQKYPNVHIKCDDAIHGVALIGPNDVISEVQIAALTMLNTIEKKRLLMINSSIISFLTEMKDSGEVKTLIERKFTEDDAKAYLCIDEDGVHLRVRTDADQKRAVNAILQLVRVETIQIDEAVSAIVSTPHWKHFTQSLGKEPCTVCVKPHEAIIVVGVLPAVNHYRKKIDDFLDENALRRFFLKMPYGSARFILEKSKEFSDEACKKLEIRCSLSPEIGGGVLVEGKRKSLQQARATMVQLMHDVTEFPQAMSEPGIRQYYQGKEGKEFLRMMERANNCIILESKSCPEWERVQRRTINVALDGKSQNYPIPQSQCCTSVTLPNSQVSIQVWKANIIEHKCDVIVNASNPELQLLLRGVSGVIKDIDCKHGNVIQAEMTNLVQSNSGSFLSGDAVITTAGGLTNCKQIIHAIGPKWNSSERDPSKALKACIFNSLLEAGYAGMKSIAIPAVSCGVFGGKPGVCIPLIVEAAMDYLKEETQTTITRVDFIENQNQAVLDEFTRAVQKYGAGNSASGDKSKSSLQSNSQPRSAFSAKPSSLNVQLQQGDIASCQDDVLVNITSTQNFTNMQGSAISKALLQKGGSVIQQECALTAGPYNVGSVFRTSGGQLACQEIYHGIVSNYSTNSKQIVKGIVLQCLRTADSTGYSSVAFPAIATGGFRHPAGEVAKWMNEEISNFTPTNLQKVTIVLYPGDTSTISAFQAEFSGAAATQSTSGHSGGNFGGIIVNVYQGDITKETSDAIVNSVNNNFNLSRGLVANAIVRSGGSRIQTEVQAASGTDCRVTSGGNLPCSKIFHMVSPGSDSDIIKRVLMVLDLADKQGITSISFPALGAGSIGLSASSVADSMRKAFEKFGKSQFASIQAINVVIFDQSVLADFKKGILSPGQSLFAKVKNSIGSLFGKSSSSKENLGVESERYVLFLYSTDKASIKKALEAITRETKKMVHRQSIQDDALGRLSDWELWELRQVEAANKVKISDKSNAYLQQIVVEGLMRDVMEANTKIKDILKEFCEAETTAKYVTWQKLVHGKWENYQPRVGHNLEKAFKIRNGNNTDPKLNQIAVTEFRNGKLYRNTVDLSNLEQDHNGQNPPKVRRRVNEKGSDDVIPSFWAPMQNQRFLKVPLQQGSQEYQEAYNAFARTGGPAANIVKIERIQNVSLYKQYVAKKAEVAKKLTSGNPVERQLFHGTADDDKIIMHGFDRSYAGKNATVHGVGVYFAVNASYSNHYAVPNRQGQRRMFLANVVTGDYCQGQSSYRAAPPKPHGTPNDLYDSVVNTMAGPYVFIIFKDASAYPKFLITYQ